MKRKAVDVIRAEHEALGAILSTLRAMVSGDDTAPLDFAALRAMLVYIAEFPEKLHHVKESRVLFPMIRQRAREAEDILSMLDRDHAAGEAAIRGLEHELLAYEMLGPSRRATFVDSLERYVKFYFEHMRLEETQVLPLAERVLTDDDWKEIDAAFHANRDPLTGHAADEPYRELFSRIATSTPAPFGLARPRASRKRGG
jgi:hemerythrin-like domain-containing protein